MLTAARTTGGACAANATSCAFAEGTCTCEVYCGPQYPTGHSCDAGTPTTWQCTGASAGCPPIRPHLGSACSQQAQQCPYGDCNGPILACESGAWVEQPTGCPISSKKYKQGIAYLDDAKLEELADRTVSTRLATYQYKEGDPSTHLGFIIEDDPTSPAVLQGRGRVDLYGYTSMTVATLQVQAKEIAALKREIADLRKDLADSKRLFDLPRAHR